ncbi:MAG TPA: hypothetical protein VJ978_07350, partial [Nitriliruptoraceae bacterium]|nr:hypothetical protein [Nitriliruptoraceae bacterium]
LYGGWGNDFVHGNEGDDFLSGAEAPDQVYGGVDYFDDPFAFLDAVYGPDQFDATCGGCRDVLQHGFRPGEFRWYDENDPLARIEVEAAGGGTVWFLGDVVPENVSGGGDGDDRLFGDGGFDWLVGGTGADWMFGGWGDDLHDADDDKTSNGGANDVVDTPDPSTSYADIAYGGAGRDIFLGNVGDDRLTDWSGEFNSYVVPFNPFGEGTVSRMIAPSLQDWLLQVGAAAGADITRCAGNTLCTGGRNGEPFGELGMVIQQDAAWGDQHGAPDDPQPGNKGGKKNLTAESVGPAGATTTELDGDGLAEAFATAIAMWRAAGVDPGVLSTIEVGIADLPGAILAHERGGAILVDHDAAGWGWNVGMAIIDAGRMDLLTTLLHEIGHALGLDHGVGLMAETIAPGVRWTDLAGFAAALSSGSTLLSASTARSRSTAQFGSTAQLGSTAYPVPGIATPMEPSQAGIPSVVPGSDAVPVVVAHAGRAAQSVDGVTPTRTGDGPAVATAAAPARGTAVGSTVVGLVAAAARASLGGGVPVYGLASLAANLALAGARMSSTADAVTGSGLPAPGGSAGMVVALAGPLQDGPAPSEGRSPAALVAAVGLLAMAGMLVLRGADSGRARTRGGFIPAS